MVNLAQSLWSEDVSLKEGKREERKGGIKERKGGREDRKKENPKKLKRSQEKEPIHFFFAQKLERKIWRNIVWEHFLAHTKARCKVPDPCHLYIMSDINQNCFL